MLKNKTVLIVDDDDDDRLFLHMALHKLYPGCHIVEATDAIEALSKISEGFQPDYIIMDINMPRMTGIECLTYLKGKPDTNTIPIIIWSTSNNAKLMEQCKRLGASAYMVKQHTMQKLLEVVNTTLIQAFPS